MCSLKLSLQIYLSLVKRSWVPQSPAPTTCSPAAASLPRTSTVVMISSLQCFWQVWLSASLPELNSLHSIQSLQEHIQRGRLSTCQKLHEHRDSALGTLWVLVWRLHIYTKRKKQLQDQASPSQGWIYSRIQWRCKAAGRFGVCLPFGCQELHISYCKIHLAWDQDRQSCFSMLV